MEDGIAGLDGDSVLGCYVSDALCFVEFSIDESVRRLESYSGQGHGLDYPAVTGILRHLEKDRYVTQDETRGRGIDKITMPSQAEHLIYNSKEKML